MSANNDRDLDTLLELGDRIVKMATAGGATVAECMLRSGAELSARVRLGEAELVEEAGHRSAGLRIMKGRQVATTSTSDFSDAGIDRFVKDAIELVELSQEDPFAGPADPKLLCDPKSLPDLELYDSAGGQVNAAQAIDIAKRGEAAARSFDSRITNSDGATFGRTAGGMAMALSSGFRASYKGSYQSLSVVPVAEDEGGKKRRGYHWTAKRHLAELDDAEEVGREAARRTLRKLGARTVATGEFPVVFDPDAARSILGLLSGCIMGSSIWRKSSYLIGREGTRIASDLVTIVDDPLIPRAPGSRPFDGEGLASRKNVVVEKGILKMYLCDSYSARKLSRESTASASRGGSAGVGAGTTNFILSPGTESKDAIVKGTKRGLYVTEMMGFGFNAVTGDFSRGASGFWIENGELAFPVSEVTISLNVDDLWQRLDALGSDLDLRTSTAAPTIRIGKMTIAGGMTSEK
ncbi:MAG: TldE protein part of TldE/TldD proteolytic complex [Myxococcaceae bacterium]|nr:TldE protein part of TldE/TldD proteolytic complex [Myxococcaceae bacterium]